MALMEFARNHVENYILTNGEVGHMFDSRPFTEGRSGLVTTLLLKVKGRKSGKDRIFPLQYQKFGNGYLVVASNGGNDRDPHWLLNLRENVVGVIQIKDRVFRAVGYILPGEQRQEAWAALVAEHPWFVDYQARTDRLFPLVLMTPIDPLKDILTEEPLSSESEPFGLDLLPAGSGAAPASSPSREERLQRLLDKDEIYDCWLRYCRGVDRCDAELMRSAYHEDAVEDHGGYVGPASGFIDWGQNLVRDIFESCMHFVTNFSCDLQGDEAHVEFYYLSVEKPHDAERHLRVGRYIQKYERRNGRWAVAQGLCLVECDNASFYDREGSIIVDSLFVPARRDREDPSYARPLQVDPKRFTVA